MSSSISMRVRILFRTSGIRVVLSCSLNISYSSSFHTSLGPQSATGTPVVPALPSSPAQMSSSSSEAASFPRSSPPLARHIRRTVLAFGRHERAAPAGDRGYHDRGMRASVAEIAATAVRATRLAMPELAASVMNAACAAAVELEALCGSSTNSSVSANGGTDVELKLAREAAREQVVQWAAVHPQGHGGGSPNGRGCVGGAPGGGMRGVRAPDSGDNPDRHGRAGGWVDGDHGLYRWRGSPSPDRYHGHHGIHAIVRDIGIGSGWPTLTKTNYVEWDTLMRVRLQVRHMWKAV
jgi:hypothetical protein